MRCEHCGRNEVNFHYSSNINGVVTERHLCSDCARELGYNSKRLSFSGSMLDGLLGSFFDTPADFPGALGFVTPMLFAPLPQVGILIQNGGERATPKIPEQDTDIDADMKQRRELNILREEMRKAVENEDFEKAIELRETIKKLSADK